MKAITYSYDYSKKKDFKFALFSDLHIDAKHCQKDKLIKNLQYAYDNTDGIFLNGDIFSCLLPKDQKRFTLAHAIVMRDDVLDYIIDYVSEVLTPFADKIKVISMGNHESSVLKFHGTNPISLLCRELKRAGGNPVFGDYQNLIRFKFYHKYSGSRVRNYDMWTCHGMGAGAKRSRGALEWDLVYSRFDARLYWMGHNHMAESDGTGSYTFMNRAGEIVTVPKKGVRTSSWEEMIPLRDINAPYDIKYGEERHGLPVAPPQFAILELDLHGQEAVKDTVCLKDV